MTFHLIINNNPLLMIFDDDPLLTIVNINFIFKNNRIKNGRKSF